MKNLYRGDVYKLTRSVCRYNDEINIERTISLLGLINYTESVVVPPSIIGFDEDSRLYMSDVLMVRLDDAPVSDFIVIDDSDNYIKLHSFPIIVGDLFVDMDSIKPCLEDVKVKKHRLIKAKFSK